jgi:glycosyltransferase involved in cell wall biosynthesis
MDFANPGQVHSRRKWGGPVVIADRTIARKRILFPCLTISSFIQKDLDLLRSEFDVVAPDCRTWAGMLSSLRWVAGVDAVFCWFGSLRFLPLVAAARAIGKPIVIVAGGYDVASVPAIGYGNMLHRHSRVLGRWLFRCATRVLPVSRFAALEATDNAGIPAQKLRMIPLGFDFRDEGLPLNCPKQPLVVTLAFGNLSSIERKGIAQVARVSRLLPDIPFVIAGRCDAAAQARLRELAGPNVEFRGWISDAERRELFARANVYLQPSIHEGFGCAVAEAMLQNCIPVVSPVGALPEVVGPTGYYAAAIDLEGLARQIRAALVDKPSDHRESPRARIETRYAASERRRQLLALMREILSLPAAHSSRAAAA